MKLEYEVSDDEIGKLATNVIRERMGAKRLPSLVGATIETQLSDVVSAMDFRPAIREAIDGVVAEIVRDAVGQRLRGIIRATLNQEIEKTIASAKADAEG